MKLKLDENLGTRGAELLRQAGHDVATVAEQNLCSSEDRPLIEVCRTEGRCLVTLDLDFSNPLLFRPSDYPGIVVLRLPARPSLAVLLELVRTLIGALDREEIQGHLWVVQRNRIRIYQEDPDDSV